MCDIVFASGELCGQSIVEWSRCRNATTAVGRFGRLNTYVNSRQRIANCLAIYFCSPQDRAETPRQLVFRIDWQETAVAGDGHPAVSIDPDADWELP